MTNKIIHNFDNRRNIALPGNEEDTITFAVNHFIGSAQNAIEAKGSFSVALSGGSTPKKIFQQLALPKHREAIQWERVYLFWSDERSVSPEDPDSNYKMAMDAGLALLPIPKNQIHRMVAEKDIKQNAKEYENCLKKHLGKTNLDLVMLGMGDDGHTASLFPGTKALNISNCYIVANEVPSKKTWRMTFTYPLINSANEIVIYVIGKNKKERLASVLLDHSDSAPSGKVGTSNHPALWIIDDAGAEKLLESWNYKKQTRNAI